MTQIVKLHFPHGFDERDEHEAPLRGVFDQVVAILPNGREIPLVFYDPTRLAQDLSRRMQQGEPCIAEPFLLVIPEVTQKNMQAAVDFAFDRNYFERGTD
ncbi:MAG: hypothetical protein EAZ30_11485 [Betaproteobacteria bacterium]|nr:MAG: hypothetical protein EAZ30_11485 [Betaproteobacteria bacterium]